MISPEVATWHRFRNDVGIAAGMIPGTHITNDSVVREVAALRAQRDEAREIAMRAEGARDELRARVAELEAALSVALVTAAAAALENTK